MENITIQLFPVFPSYPPTFQMDWQQQRGSQHQARAETPPGRKWTLKLQ